MPQIPGVPTLSPVARPTMSPQAAGVPGAVVAGIAGESGEIAGVGQALQFHIKEAQKHVDTLAAKNEIDATVSHLQDDLLKTNNSRDVAEIIAHWKGELNNVSRRWEKSPALQEIELRAQSMVPLMDHLGTVRQVDLMGKELKVNLSHQAEVLSDEYASGNKDAALSAFTADVDKGRSLLGDAEADDMIRRFKEIGQEKQIKNAIANADPKVNQAIYDEMNAHPEKFPDVNKEFLEASKGHALAAKESHIKNQEWAEGQLALETMLRPVIDAHTNPATNQFDESSARADIAQQYKDGKISIFQKEALTKGIESYGGDVNAGNKKKAIQVQDDIIKMFHDRQYQKAYQTLEKSRPWLENSGYAELYKNLMNYGDTMQRQDRAESREFSRGAAVAMVGWMDRFDAGADLNDPKVKAELYGDRNLTPESIVQISRYARVQEDKEIRNSLTLANDRIKKFFPLSETSMLMAVKSGKFTPTKGEDATTSYQQLMGDAYTKARETLAIWATQQQELAAAGKRKALTQEEIFKQGEFISLNGMPSMDTQLDAIHADRMAVSHGKNFPTPTRPKSVPADYVWNARERTWDPPR